MALSWTLRVQIEDGCNFDFGFDKNESVGGFFRCVFNKCINQSSIVQIPTFLSYDIEPTWNEALEWQFDDKTLKKLKKYGSSIKLQLCVIKNWNKKVMDTFPVNNFNKNRQKYNLQEIGYIVLDLKNAISNGTKITNFNNPRIQSTYLRIRNVKIAKNNGIHPKVKVAFWCALQAKWNDIKPEPEPEPQREAEPQQPLQTQPSQSQPPQNTDIDRQRNAFDTYTNDTVNSNESDNNDSIINKKWFCVIHKMELFIDISNIRLLIVSMNERFVLHEDNLINNEFCNNYPNFSWYLQSSTSTSTSMDKSVPTEWSTLASYSTNILQFISNNHSKQFILKLFGAHNKCIANATISISWQSYSCSNAYDSNDSIANQTITQQISEKSSEISEMYGSEISEFNTLIFENDDNLLSVSHNEDKEDNYKYRIGIDIRSIRDLSASYNICCKYKYILFDNNRLFQSKPPILINKCQEKSINDGFCAYEIMLKSKELCTNLYEYPLIIQCLDITNNTNVEIGYCFINLSDLLKTDKSASNLRYIDKYYTIYSIKNKKKQTLKTFEDLNKIKCKPMGNMRVCCSLEDFKVENIEKQQQQNADNIDKIDTIENIDGDNKNDAEIIKDSNMTPNFLQNAQYLQEEIILELKKWKKGQQENWQKKWKLLETEKLNNLELEWKKNEELRSQQLNKKKLEIIKLEKKLKTSLYDIECQEKKLKLEQMRIEERKRELNQNYKLKTHEIVSSLKRLRNDNKMEIETLNRTIKFLKNENDLISSKYRNEEKRCNEFRDELNKNKKKYDSSSIGHLQIENNKLDNKILELNDKISDKNEQIKILNKKLDQNGFKINDLQNQIIENSKKQIDKEKKQMDKLKIELMTKSHFKQLRNDRTELQQIKNTLNKIMDQQQQ